MAKKKPFPCIECAGIGERNPANCTHHRERFPINRRALRCVWDRDGRWLIHWREEDGEEWCGTYRLLPC